MSGFTKKYMYNYHYCPQLQTGLNPTISYVKNETKQTKNQTKPNEKNKQNKQNKHPNAWKQGEKPTNQTGTPEWKAEPSPETKQTNKHPGLKNSKARTQTNKQTKDKLPKDLPATGMNAGSLSKDFWFGCNLVLWKNEGGL